MKKFFSTFGPSLTKALFNMTTEQLQEAVAEIIEKMPNLHRTAYRINVSHATVRAYRKKLPKQVAILNDLLRTVGKELAIIQSSEN